MKRRAWQWAAGTLAMGCCLSLAEAQPQAPPGYSVEEYFRKSGLQNPVGMAFSPAGSRFHGGELFVCFDSDSENPGLGAVYRISGPGKGVFFGRGGDRHAGMAIPRVGAGFTDGLYATIPGSVLCYDPRGTCGRFAEIGAHELYAVRFAPGGGWGRDLYLLENSIKGLHRLDSNGAITSVITGLPGFPMGFDFGPGEAWGDYAYVASNGAGIFRVDANGTKSDFLADGGALGGGWLVGHTFDRTGSFGGGLFYSNLATSKIVQVDANGAVNAFASGFNFGGGNQSTGRLAFGPDGAMYVSDGDNNAIWRISRNRLGLLRDPEADTVVTAAGETHRGTLASERFVLETAMGKLDLKAAQVAGMAATEAQTVMCLLADGQIVRGKLGGEAVRITLAGGEGKTVSVDAFRQWSRRISSDYPAVVRPSGTVLALRDGQELLVEPNGVALNLRTRWGAVRLDCAGLADLTTAGASEGANWPVEGGTGKPPILHRVRLAGGSVLAGVLEGGKVSLAVRLGGRLEVAVDQIAHVRAARAEGASPWHTRVGLAGGDVLVGSLGQGAIRIRTQTGAIEIPVQEIHEISTVPAIPGGIRVHLWDGNTIGGLAEKGPLRFALRAGPEVSLPAEQIVQLTCPIRGSAEDLAKRLSQLVERLGADRFQDREAATKALIEMGPAIIPMLEPFAQHKDAEVRERVGMILRQLARVPAPAADRAE